MPLTNKGKEIMSSMKEQYGEKKGESVFYASANAGKITGVHDEPEGSMQDKSYDVVGDMTAAEINEKNKQFWAPSYGTSAGKSSNQTADEVQPTQSNPPDSRSDNLLSSPMDHAAVPVYGGVKVFDGGKEEEKESK